MSDVVTIPMKEFRFDLEARDPVSLPEYAGSTLRGAFGHAFRERACLFPGQSCRTCVLAQTCACSYVFETPTPPGFALANAGGSHVPHPFVLGPPWEGAMDLPPGAPFSFRMALVGKGIDYFPYFVLAVEEMGRRGLGRGRGRFRLAEVWDVRPEGSRSVWRGGTLRPEASADPLVWRSDDFRHPDPGELVLQFVTPLRLSGRGGLDADLDFPAFLRALLRRVKLLAACHCGNGADWDYRPLLAHGDAVQTLERDCRPLGWLRWSERQGRKMLLDGVTGFLRIAGDLKPLLPFLAIGQVIHAGKATAFGFGRYQLNPDFTR